jgi:hypothetical protein
VKRVAATWVRLKPYAGRLARDSVYLIGPALILLFGSAVATWLGMDPDDYRDAAVPLALGLVAGVPVAVWLTRLGDRAAGGGERAEASSLVAAAGPGVVLPRNRRNKGQRRCTAGQRMHAS